jgi:hypothetical protein
MKKIIISLAAASVLLFTGCFIDSDTATVRINLGNIPVAKVEKKSLIDRFLMIFAKEAVAQSVPGDLGISEINFKVFEGDSLLVEKNILISEYPVDNIVELTVPAGTNRVIRISAKDIGGALPAKVVYGVMITTDLPSGQTKEIKAYMQGVPYELYFTFVEESFMIYWMMEGPEKNDIDSFVIEWSVDNEIYVNLLQVLEEGTFGIEPISEGMYSCSISSGSPVLPSHFIRIKTVDGENIGIFSASVPVTGT